MEEEADAAALLEDVAARPAEAQWPEWSGPIQAAWDELRDDRNAGEGGLGRIYFTAIDHYAARYNITGSDFDSLLFLVRVIDDEYISHVNAERAKAMAEAEAAAAKGRGP